jgi:nitrogen regulatory protein PII
MRKFELWRDCSFLAPGIPISVRAVIERTVAERPENALFRARACANDLAGIARVRTFAFRGRAIMKLIVAVIKPFKLDEVRTTLDRLGVKGMTVSEANGYGRQKGHTEIYRGSEYNVAFMPKVRLEIAVSDHEVEPTIEAIQAAARTGQIGDGKIFVLPIERAMRIRTAETGDEAL